jgi:Ser-tRNA(Ala) deacylase AlaX
MGRFFNVYEGITMTEILCHTDSYLQEFEATGVAVADGGTQVANIREVGRMRMVDYQSKGKINKRIYIAVEA